MACPCARLHVRAWHGWHNDLAVTWASTVWSKVLWLTTLQIRVGGHRKNIFFEMLILILYLYNCIYIYWILLVVMTISIAIFSNTCCPASILPHEGHHLSARNWQSWKWAKLYMNGIPTLNSSKSTLRLTSSAGEQAHGATKLLLGRERRERVPRVLTLHSVAPPGPQAPQLLSKLCFNGEKSELNMV